MKKHYFKIRYGFKPTDFVSVEAGGELEKAIYAWSTGRIVSVGNKMVKGDNIISIEPHYHKYTGWYETYEPKEGDDFAQIERDCPNFDGVLPHYRERVTFLMQANRVKEIGTGVELPINMPIPQNVPEIAPGGKMTKIADLLPVTKTP